MLSTRQGSPFLYDAVGDIVGVKDADRGEFLFAQEPRIGTFLSNTTQTDGAGPVAVTFDTQAISRGISVSEGSKVYVDSDGVYEFQLSLRLSNTDTALHDFQLWGRINGVDIVNSLFEYTVPSSHGGIPGHLTPSQNFFLPLLAGQYVQVMWAADTEITISATPATGSMPAAPSLLLTAKRIARYNALT